MATDSYQSALPENYPAWDERSCPSPMPWNGLAVEDHTAAAHSLYSTLSSSPTPQVQATAAQCHTAGRCSVRGGRDCSTLSCLTLGGEGRGSILSLKFHGSCTYYFAYMAQCTPLFAFTVFHLIWGCNNNFFHDYDVFFLPFTVFNAGRRREQVKVTTCGHPTPPANPKFPAHCSANN